jgi:hypothetical protein
MPIRRQVCCLCRDNQSRCANSPHFLRPMPSPSSLFYPPPMQNRKLFHVNILNIEHQFYDFSRYLHMTSPLARPNESWQLSAIASNPNSAQGTPGFAVIQPFVRCVFTSATHWVGRKEQESLSDDFEASILLLTYICRQMVQEGSIGFGRPPVPIMAVGISNVNDPTAVVEFCTKSSGIGTS